SVQETEPQKTEPEKTEPPETPALIATPAPEPLPAPIVTQAPIKENVVYVAASGKGKRYHSNPNCSGMNGEVIKMTKEQAEAQGLTPCQKNTCYG
ncbi:MAG: hypothetical protein K2K41_05515, partial [Ruminiclostridium sp.]|nr:hypothetical protein [Ruminiclostridium sp.]